MGLMRFMVADPSIRNKTDPIDGKSVQSLYQEYGLFFTPGNNNIESGILKVNSYIERGKWKVHRQCVNLIKEGIGYKFPELSMDTTDKNLDEKPIKANDHAMDSIRYGFQRLPDDPDTLKNVSFSPDLRYTTARKYENEYGYNKNTDEDDEDFDSSNPKSWASYV